MSIFQPLKLDELESEIVTNKVAFVEDQIQRVYDHKLKQKKKEWFELLERKEWMENGSVVFPRQNQEPFVMMPISHDVLAMNPMQFDPNASIEIERKEVQKINVTLQSHPIHVIKEHAAHALAKKLIEMGMISNTFEQRRGYTTFYINFIK